MARTRSCAVPYCWLILVIILSLALPHTATAQQDDINDLINQINGLRASLGLAAYSVDQRLMAIAQEHSAYQASIHTSTHQHSDGSVPAQLGVVENVAAGALGFMVPENAVYGIWVDALHQHTMIGFASGSMGVGIADDGETVYYTLVVVPSASEAPAAGATPTTQTVRSGSSATGESTPQAPLTPIPSAPLMTTTPRSDGTIVHVVGYGQSLWAIALAYGVTVDQIRAWNNIAEGSNDIYDGQKLLVRPTSLVTPLPSVSPTGAAPTESPLAPIQPTTTETRRIPSPTAFTTQPAPTVVSPISAEARENVPSPDSTDGLIPLAAGVFLLAGGILLLVLLRKKIG